MNKTIPQPFFDVISVYSVDTEKNRNYNIFN